MNVYQQGTLEFQPVTIELDNVAITDWVGVKLAALPRGTSPTVNDWMDPELLNSQHGFFVDDTFLPGAYYVWAKVEDNPEIPILQLGTFAVKS